MTFRLTKEKILYYFMISLPFLDAINGILSRQYGKSIGTVYHTALTILLCIYAFRCKKVKQSYFALLFCFFIICFMSVIVATLIGNSNHIAYDLLIKFFCTILDLYSLLVLIDNRVISVGFCDRILRYNLIVIPISILFSKVSGLGNSAYIYSNQGFLGFYSSSNELNCILLILVYYALAKYYVTNKLKYFILIITQCVCAIMIESKISMGMCAIALIIVLARIIKRFKSKINKKILLFIPLFIVAIVFSPVSISEIFNSFISRQNSLKMGYTNIFVYLSSGRISRINEIFSYNFSGVGIIVFLFRFFFGNGFCNVVEKNYFEMEYLDMFIWSGLIGLLLFIWMTIKIFKESYKKQGKSIIQSLCIFVIFVCSFFSGHAFCGGGAGIYIALTCACFMKFELRKE